MGQLKLWGWVNCHYFVVKFESPGDDSSGQALLDEFIL
jgi:hypothetical protein